MAQIRGAAASHSECDSGVYLVRGSVAAASTFVNTTRPYELPWSCERSCPAFRHRRWRTVGRHYPVRASGRPRRRTQNTGRAVCALARAVSRSSRVRRRSRRLPLVPHVAPNRSGQAMEPCCQLVGVRLWILTELQTRRGRIAGERSEVPRLRRNRLRLVLGNRSGLQIHAVDRECVWFRPGGSRSARRAGITLSTLKRNRRSGGLFGQLSIHVNRSATSYIARWTAAALYVCEGSAASQCLTLTENSAVIAAPAPMLRHCGRVEAEARESERRYARCNWSRRTPTASPPWVSSRPRSPMK